MPDEDGYSLMGRIRALSPDQGFHLTLRFINHEINFRGGRGNPLLVRRGLPLPTSSLRIYFASGSGRTWNLRILLVVPFPPSTWNGVRVAKVVQMPLPFQPPRGSSIRPSIPFA